MAVIPISHQSELQNKTYHERLQNLGLTTLHTIRLRGYLIQAYKIINGLDDVKTEHFYRFKCHANCRLRGHSQMMAKPKARLDVRKYCFSH